jgi:toxin ParE1/3/4
MMRVTLRPEARAEVLAAKEWYDRQVPGLGRDFARGVDSAIASIRRNPDAYHQIDVDCRRVLLPRFPYSLVYRVEPNNILVVAVFHNSREPGFWEKRLR